MSWLGFSRVLGVAEILSSWRSLYLLRSSMKMFHCPDLLADNVAFLLLVEEQIIPKFSLERFWRVLPNARIQKYRKLKAGILKPGITKIKHRTDKGWFTRTTQAQIRWPTTVTAEAICHFYLQFYSLPNNFWFRQIDRDQKKPVSTIFIHNLEMKSQTVFCLVEVSLFSFDQIVVTLHRRALVTPPSPP